MTKKYALKDSNPLLETQKMAEVLIVEIDVEILTPEARMALRAAVFHALENRDTSHHVIPVVNFCRLAGLPILKENEIAQLLSDASKALGIIELVNTELPDNMGIGFLSWQLIQKSDVKDGNVNFQLYQHTYKEIIRTELLSALTDQKLF